MSSFNDILAADQRLVLIRTLHELAGGRSNASVLHSALQHIGHHVSRDQVDTHLHWLREQDLVKIEHETPVLVVRLTDRGHDVATGAAQVPGVKRPRL